MNYWYNDAIFYSIYPLGAVNDKRENDYVPAAGTTGMEQLAGWIDHIASIGCNAIYFAPVFESRTHGYDTTDYRKIDSRLGTNRQFADLVARCHEAGLRVVVDGVFNHTGRDFFAFRDLREKGAASPYKEWYQGVHFGGGTPMGDSFSYEAWRGHYELPRLNPHNPQVREHLFDAARMWIREFGIDGIRLDCADCLDFGFMKELRRVCVAERADFWLMGEIIHGDYTKWANGDTLHSVTNYECSKGLYSSHNDGNMHEIAYSINRQFGDGGIYKGLMLYNFADNHDLNRLADTVKKPQHLPTVYTILYTMPGLPSVYYGSEWGIHGVTDRITDWALRPRVDIKTAHRDDPALLAHITALARARASSKALRHGAYRQLAVTSHQLAFRRSLDEEEAIVLVNIAGHPESMAVEAKGAALADLLHPGDVFPLTGGRAVVPVPAHGSRILRPVSDAEAVIHRDSVPQTQPVEPARPQPTPPTPPTPQPMPPAAPHPEPTSPPAPMPDAPKAAPPPPSPDGIVVARFEDLAPIRREEHPVFVHERRDIARTATFGASFYELAPGKSAYPYHWHTSREEVFVILTGQGLLRTPDGERAVRAGDVLFFPAGEAGAHRLINNHHEPLRYVDVDTLPRGDVSIMPDSGKVNLGGGRIFRMGEPAGYYDGE